MRSGYWLVGMGCLIVIAIVVRAMRDPVAPASGGKTTSPSPAAPVSRDGETPLYDSLLISSLDRLNDSELVATPTPARPATTPPSATPGRTRATPRPGRLPAATPAPGPGADSESPRNAIEQGRLAFAAGQWEQAIAFYDRALAANEKNYLVHSLRGDALLRLDRFEEALAGYRRSFEINPSFTFALHGVATACLALERYDEAINAYTQILSVDSDDQTAQQMLDNVKSLQAGKQKP